jgi:hypothetical protein
LCFFFPYVLLWFLQRERTSGGDENEHPSRGHVVENDDILCNGAPLKRVDLSVKEEGDILVDLFVEDDDTAAPQGLDSQNVLWLEPFEEASDEEGGRDWVPDDEEDVDGAEIDYPSSESSSRSIDRDDDDQGS